MHEDLQNKEKSGCRAQLYPMLVATFIATEVFAATFSVPGGNNQQIGTPTHLDKTLFNVLAVSDAIALSSSSISVLIFLSIIISCYKEEDIHMWLPFKLSSYLL
ncbi:hypothetical protein ACOSP7_007496 [Xanthoceras sorbifolium]